MMVADHGTRHVPHPPSLLKISFNSRHCSRVLLHECSASSRRKMDRMWLTIA